MAATGTKVGGPVQLTLTVAEWKFLVDVFAAYDRFGFEPLKTDEGKSLKAKVERIEQVRRLRDGN